MSWNAGGLPRIKLDLTADERVVLAPVRLPVFHSYADGTDVEFEALTYSYEEAFAEKVRALAERTRPRDLYDVVNLFRNSSARPAAAVLLDFFDWLRTGATPEEPGQSSHTHFDEHRLGISSFMRGIPMQINTARIIWIASKVLP